MSKLSYIRRRYLIAYDIVDDKKRTKVFEICSEEGDRIQYSVFIVELNETELIKFKGKINSIINSRTDQVLFVDLGAAKRSGVDMIFAIGRRYEPQVRTIVI